MDQRCDDLGVPPWRKKHPHWCWIVILIQRDMYANMSIGYSDNWFLRWWSDDWYWDAQNIGMMTSYDIYPVVFTEGFVSFFSRSYGGKNIPDSSEKGTELDSRVPQAHGLDSWDGGLPKICRISRPKCIYYILHIIKGSWEAIFRATCK